MKKEQEEGTFPQGWNDACEDAMFAALGEFTQSNRCVIQNSSPDAIAQNSFIEGFIACCEYCASQKAEKNTCEKSVKKPCF